MQKLGHICNGIIEFVNTNERDSLDQPELSNNASNFVAVLNFWELRTLEP